MTNRSEWDGGPYGEPRPAGSWPSRRDALREAEEQAAACYCHAISTERRPCAACRAARMIAALVKQADREIV